MNELDLYFDQDEELMALRSAVLASMKQVKLELIKDSDHFLLIVTILNKINNYFHIISVKAA